MQVVDYHFFPVELGGALEDLFHEVKHTFFKECGSRKAHHSAKEGHQGIIFFYKVTSIQLLGNLIGTSSLVLQPCLIYCSLTPKRILFTDC